MCATYQPSAMTQWLFSLVNPYHSKYIQVFVSQWMEGSGHASLLSGCESVFFSCFAEISLPKCLALFFFSWRSFFLPLRFSDFQGLVEIIFILLDNLEESFFFFCCLRFWQVWYFIPLANPLFVTRMCSILNCGVTRIFPSKSFRSCVIVLYARMFK